MDNADAEWFHNQGFVTSSREVSSCSRVHFHANFTARGGEYGDKPILVLLHGYPQSSFLWRYAANFLPKDTPMFIPDLPGYGRSTPAYKHDKRVIGESVAEALALYLGYNITNTDRIRIILVGHDRGARVAHRLALDISHGIDGEHQVEVYNMFDLKGLISMDILPTAEQWKIFGATSKNMARSFHWPLLANVDLATEMIRAFGGGKWCMEMMRRWSGDNEEGQRSLQRGNAFEVYGRYFDQESVIRATSEDYRAGAEEDVVTQEGDQEVSKQLQVPTLVLYSSDYSGKRYGPQMKQIWSWWIADPEQLEVEEITDSGHFIAEEQPRQTYEAVKRFYEKVEASESTM